MPHTRKAWHERDEFEGAAKLTDRLLHRSGPLAYVAPNVLTLLGGILVLPMCLSFLLGGILPGAIFFALCTTIDWIDGALARYQDRHLPHLAQADAEMERSEWVRRGPTQLGKKIDPFFDKIRYFAAVFPLGWNILPHALIWTSLGIAAALTVFRLIVEWRWNLRPGSNVWGKIKVYVEIGAVALLVFQAAGAPLSFFTILIFVAATALGAVSLASQAWSAHRQSKQNRNR